MRFVDLSLKTMQSYPAILSQLADPQSESRLIDVGCDFGSDLRKLTFAIANLSGGRLWRLI